MSRSLFASLFARGAAGGPVPALREARINTRLRELAELPAAFAGCTATLKKTRVAVVGGGLAGLMAAKILGRHGAVVTLFEANKKVGGRARSNTTFSAGRVTEEGAELIGSMHLTWLALARELGVGLISIMEGDYYARVGLHVRVELDKLLTWPEVVQVATDMRDKILIPFGSDAKKIIDPAAPWAQTIHAKQIADWDRMSVAARLTALGIAKGSRIWMAMELLLCNNNVAPLEKLNYLGMLCLVRGNRLVGQPDDDLLGYWTELEIFRCANGCQTIAERMAKSIAGTIEPNALVTSIDLDQRSLKWVPVAGGRPGTKTTKVPFDYVILATPPGVWPKEILPHHPKTTIGLMGKGAAAKFFSNVGARFWIQKNAAPLGGAPDIGQVWEGTDNQTQNGAQGVVLSVFTGNRIPPESDYRKGLERLYPGYEKQILAYKAHNPTKPATKLVDWNKEPFIETGYASPGLGQILTIGKELNEPYLGRLFFAGEHTQMSAFGYMEGALLSGERAAKGVLQRVCGKPIEMVSEAEAGAEFADDDAMLEELYASVLGEP